MTQHADRFGNVCTRVVAPQGRTTFFTDFVISDSGDPDPVLPNLGQTPIENLPDEVLIFLLGHAVHLLTAGGAD